MYQPLGSSTCKFLMRPAFASRLISTSIHSVQISQKEDTLCQFAAHHIRFPLAALVSFIVNHSLTIHCAVTTYRPGIRLSTVLCGSIARFLLTFLASMDFAAFVPLSVAPPPLTSRSLRRSCASSTPNVGTPGTYRIPISFFRHTTASPTDYLPSELVCCGNGAFFLLLAHMAFPYFLPYRFSLN